MSKFATASRAVRQPDRLTHEGGAGFSKDPLDELFTLGLTNMVGVDTFYERGEDRDKRFVDLLHACTEKDSAWTRAYIGWLRSDGNMRSASVVAAVEYLRAGGEGARAVIDSVCQRPDEPAEVLAYWSLTAGAGRHTKLRLPMALKRGVADACRRLYNENAVLRYDGGGSPWRFGDVIELTHPKPSAPWQSALYRHCIDRRHGRGDIPTELATLRTDAAALQVPEDQRRAHLPEVIAAGWSWERVAGWLPGGMDAAAWEAVIPNMGAMALVRNLRNFDQAGISPEARDQVEAALKDTDAIRRSRQFPLRFLSAWLNVDSVHWGSALERALQHSLDNIPTFSGRTLVLVDVSPSMRDTVGGRRTDRRGSSAIQPKRWQAAAVFGGAVAQRCEDHDLALFDSTVMARSKMNRGDSLLRFSEQCHEFANRSNGTDILRALAEMWDGHDRVVILTDEQTGYDRGRRALNYINWTERWGWNDVAHIKAPVYTFNLAGYSTGVTPNEGNWLTVGGLSDACFSMIAAFESRRDGSWPWELRGATTNLRP